jgi:hypothetical protein
VERALTYHAAYLSPIAKGSDDTGPWSGPGASRWVGVDLTSGVVTPGDTHAYG